MTSPCRLWFTLIADVALEQTVWLVARLRAAAVEAELISFAGAGHGLRNPPDATPAQEVWLAFFVRHLQPAKP